MGSSTKTPGILLGPDAYASVSHARRSFANVFLFLRVFAFAAAVPCLLRLKLPKVASVLEPGVNPRIVSQAQVDKITSFVEAAIRRGRPLVRPGCLTRGLTRYYFLRRAGMDVALCFGMGLRNHEFMGHCWLVKDNEPFLEAEDPRPLYTVMYRISRAGGTEVAAAPFGGFLHR